ncbi:MAG: DNA-directed RNA polymerase subunit alpha C-terminal domain-containing protein, partial [Terriglobia bacterium]
MDQDGLVPLEDLKSTTIFVPPSARKRSVRELSLSVRLKHTLGHLGCKSLGDLQGVTFGRVLKSPGCGLKTVRELERYLKNVELGMLDQPGIPKATQAPTIHREHNSDNLLENQSVRDECTRPALIYIPQCARGWGLAQMPTSVRLAGVLKQMGFHLVGDLHGLSFDRFRGIENCGRHTRTELANLISQIQAGEFEYFEVESGDRRINSLIGLVDQHIAKLPIRDRGILLSRFGGNRKAPATLED